MTHQPYTHLIAIGACYIDTILTVPAYPPEDAKQRASSISRRRGGNCPNTLEVLQQLLSQRVEDQHRILQTPPELILLSTLPSQDSSDTKFVVDSFDNSTSGTSAPSLYSSNRHNEFESTQDLPVNLSHAFHRPQTTAASSYIVQSQSTNSRTIVNYNGLDEMTLSEFQHAINSLLTSYTTDQISTSTQPHPDLLRRIWFHFEGRIPETTLQCIKWLREIASRPANANTVTRATAQPTLRLTISVECEKPNRPGLDDLASHADVVFYSRSWAEGQGHRTAEACLRSEMSRTRAAAANKDNEFLARQRRVLLCCTWGEEGASAAEVDLDFHGLDVDGRQEIDEVASRSDKGVEIVNRGPWSPPSGTLKVVDTIGAGDTWIAGMLFGFVTRPEWQLVSRVEFANEVAGRKIGRGGFGRLGMEMSRRNEEQSF